MDEIKRWNHGSKFFINESGTHEVESAAQWLSRLHTVTDSSTRLAMAYLHATCMHWTHHDFLRLYAFFSNFLGVTPPFLLTTLAPLASQCFKYFKWK